MKYPKFSHKTPHLKGKQHQLDPNLDLKQLVHHSTVQYVDRDADGDVDVYDTKKKGTPDENPVGDVGSASKKLIAKQKGELKHTKRGIAYEDLRKWFGKGGEGGVGGGGWDRYNTKGERIGKCAREPGEPKPKCLSKEKAAKMSKDDIAAAVRRKRASDPVADRPGKGGKPVMVSNKIKEAKEEQRFCPLCNKMEGRSECSFGGDLWDALAIKSVNEAKKSEQDHEQSMIRSELATIKSAVRRLQKKMKGEGNVEAWVQSKITKAADYIDTAADYIESGEHNVEEAKTDPCWDGYKQVGMKKKGEKMVPNCVKESDLSISEKILLEMEAEVLNEKNVPTNPALWSKMKSRAKAKFDVYPSAYANGWAAKEYKKAGGGWKTQKEEVQITDADGNLAYEVIDLIKPEPLVKPEKVEIEEAVRLPAKNGNLIMVILTWRGKTISTKMFFPQTTLPKRREVEAEVQKIYPDSKVAYFSVSKVEPGEPIVQVTTEDWQKVNKSDKTDGMSQKAVNAYRRENPGSKLKTAVTEKDPGPGRSKRRKSFCARSKGQQDMHNIDCSKDPDKAICKARRRWRC